MFATLNKSCVWAEKDSSLSLQGQPAALCGALYMPVVLLWAQLPSRRSYAHRKNKMAHTRRIGWLEKLLSLVSDGTASSWSLLLDNLLHSVGLNTSRFIPWIQYTQQKSPGKPVLFSFAYPPFLKDVWVPYRIVILSTHVCWTSHCWRQTHNNSHDSR